MKIETDQARRCNPANTQSERLAPPVPPRGPLVPDTLKYGIRYGTDYGAIPYPYMCGFAFRDAGGPVTRALGFFVLSSTAAVKRVGCTRRTFTSLHFAREQGPNTF